MRNTAMAVAMAALSAVRADDVLLILPSDHDIPQADAFLDDVLCAYKTAVDGQIVTFGISPTCPHSGYGYINAPRTSDDRVRRVLSFHEKPNAHTAQQYIDAGQYYWNSGIFMSRADVWLAELQRHAPDVYVAAVQAWQEKSFDLGDILPSERAYARAPSRSIDYAVMEKTSAAHMITASFTWRDLGDYAALYGGGEKDEHENVMSGDVATKNVRGSYLYADGMRLGVIGLSDVIAVATRDAVMVCARDQANQISGILDRMKDQAPMRTDRPWGYYDVIEHGAGFAVKKLHVLVGCSLSLQSHEKRSEHWVILKGRARVTCDERVIALGENESTFIPQGARHCLENIGDEALEVIEIQTGSYLGEDDIVRYAKEDARTIKISKGAA